mmetsp:Transcript_27794/g.81327  ORF Transcript_27794/g.81327 Transcript_27794/m.81327 type:complete len:80 (-) Transcript_27794:2204-2443(-)
MRPPLGGAGTTGTLQSPRCPPPRRNEQMVVATVSLEVFGILQKPLDLLCSSSVGVALAVKRPAEEGVEGNDEELCLFWV